MARMSIIAGLIRLQVPSKADVFLSEQIKLNEYLVAPNRFLHIIQPNDYFSRFRGLFWEEGLLKPQPLTIHLDPENTVIQGYYEDRYDRSVTIYTRYEINVYVEYEELSPEEMAAAGRRDGSEKTEETVVVANINLGEGEK